MTIDKSTGYAGDIKPGAEWANAQWGLGGRYFVYHEAHLKVTAVPSGTRQVAISSGYFGGWGVVDHNDADVLMDFPISLSGTRYDLIVARRNWITGTTSFERITGTGSTLLPVVGADGPRYGNPGVIDDQPIAFVGIAPNQTQPVEIIDLRALGTAPEYIIIRDERAKQYLAYLGTRLRLGTKEWVRTLNTAGNQYWFEIPGPLGRVELPAVTVALGASQDGWTTNSGQPGEFLTNTMILNGNSVDFTFRTRRVGGHIPVVDGSAKDNLMFILNSEWRPADTVYATALYINTDGSNSGGVASLHTNGHISFLTGSGNRYLQSKETGYSLAASFRYNLKGAA